MITLRSSGLARVMVCAGSIKFTNLPENLSGEAAQEGTAAGEVLEYMINNRTLELPAHMTHSMKDGYPFDDDMKFHAREIVKNISERAQPHTVTCEGQVVVDPGIGVRVVGHYDVMYWDHSARLCVDDLKYGWGIVEVKDNWQLLSYAIGAVTQMQLWNKQDLTVVLRILQPRPHHDQGPVREWVIGLEELKTYARNLTARLHMIAEGESTLQTSKYCRYCPAAAMCPAIGKNFYRALEYTHEFTQDEMTPDEMSFQLGMIKRAEEVMKVKKDSLEALAIDRIKKGTLIPGYVIESKLGDRTWKKMVTPDVIEAMTGKKIIKQEMLSPAQAEKLGIDKKFINSLCDRFQKGNKLVQKDTTKLGNEIFGTPQAT